MSYYNFVIKTGFVKQKYGCQCDAVVLLFSWIQVFSGIFSFQAIIVAASLPKYNGICQIKKCCQNLTLVAFLEIFVRMMFTASFWGLWITSGDLNCSKELDVN